VGCGFGELLRVGSAAVRSAAGCDPSPEMLRRCGAMDVCVQPRAADLPYPDSRFDLVTAVCVFHHIEPVMRRVLMKDVCRVLKPGGVFCMIEHNPVNPVTQWIVRRTPVDANARLLTARQARRLLSDEALRSIVTEYFLLFPERFYEKAKILEAFLRRVPLGGQYAVFGVKTH